MSEFMKRFANNKQANDNIKRSLKRLEKKWNMEDNETEFDVLWEQFLGDKLEEFKSNEAEYGCVESELMESYTNSKDMVNDFYDFICKKNGTG